MKTVVMDVPRDILRGALFDKPGHVHQTLRFENAPSYEAQLLPFEPGAAYPQLVRITMHIPDEPCPEKQTNS